MQIKLKEKINGHFFPWVTPVTDTQARNLAQVAFYAEENLIMQGPLIHRKNSIEIFIKDIKYIKQFFKGFSKDSPNRTFILKLPFKI